MAATQQDLISRFTEKYDYHDPEFTPEIAEIVHREIRTVPGVTYSAVHGGIWILARYEHVAMAFKDYATFSSAAGVFYPRAEGAPKFSPIDYDPPEHRVLRSLMAPPLQHEQVDRLEPAVVDLAAGLVRAIAERGHGDFTEQLARPLAIGVLALAIGLSESAQEQIRDLTSQLWARYSRDPDSTRFWPAFRELLAAEVRRARERPDDSYLSHLAGAKVDGAEISEETLHSVLVSYCIAGHETTMNTISRLLWYLASHPDVQRRLKAQPELMPVAVDETLRRWCPTDRFTRVTTRDVTIAGTLIPRGARVVLLVDAANRDPEKFPRPDEFSLDRGNSHRHLSFGFGIHHCLGSNLARTEVTAVLRELARQPVYRLTAEPERHFENGRHIVFDSVPVLFEGF